MTSIVLSQATQNLINAALANNGTPGANNANYIAAYNAISREINANGGFNSGTAYWFSQAGAVNSQFYQPTAAGSFIWSYTQNAAAYYGVTITRDQLLQASNQIAFTVFQQIQNAGYQFSDDPNALGNFAPASIVRDDAGAGIARLNDLNGSSLDDSIWGGTLFARTTLNDPTYFTDNNLNLTPGSADCEAIVSGLEGGLLEGAANPSFYAQGYAALNQIDGNAVQACLGVNPKTFDDGSTLTPDNGAYVYATAPSPDGATSVTAFSSTSAAQLTSTPDSNGDGESSVRFATPDETATLNGTSLNATQVTPNADGSFTFGSPQADPNGLVNQMTVNGSFGVAGLTVTNPTTGATANIALDNDSTTTLQEGRSVATDAPNEAYEAGASTVDLEVEHGICRATIRKLLRKAGCTLRDVRQASRVRDAANWTRLDKPTAVEGHLIIMDVFGATWRITHSSPSAHGFDILRGVPDGTNSSAPSIILTADLAAHFERHRLAPRNLALPMGQAVVNRIRRRLDQDWPRENAAWWLDRLDDLRDLTSSAFEQRHGVPRGTVVNARRRYCGTRPPRRDWSDPVLKAFVLSDRPNREIAAAIGTTERYVGWMRYLLRKKDREAKHV